VRAASELREPEAVLEGKVVATAVNRRHSSRFAPTSVQADLFMPHAAAFYSQIQVSTPLPTPLPPTPSLSHLFPLQSLLPSSSPTISRLRPATHIFSSPADASDFLARAPSSYGWLMHSAAAEDTEQARASAGWSAPYGFATVKGISLDVVSFLRESQSVFRAMGSFETGLVAESEVRELKQQRAIEWKDVAARSMVWAIGEQSSSLSVFSRPAARRHGSLSCSSSKAVTPLLRQTFGSISLVHCPRLHTLSSLHYAGKWLCPASSPATYLIGSSYSPSSAAALDQAPSIVDAFLPLLPAPPQLIRLNLVLFS
jgi:hypothetical protein